MNKVVIENSHDDFTGAKFCLTNLISLPFVEEERAENVTFTVLSKDFCTGFYSICIAKLETGRLDGWT